MVFKEKIKAELKGSVTFLWEEDDVPVKEIHVVQRCGISRALVHHCLKSANQAQNKNKEHGSPRLIGVCQERKIQRTIARLREQEGNFSCHRIRAEAVFFAMFHCGLSIELWSECDIHSWKQEKKEYYCRKISESV